MRGLAIVAGGAIAKNKTKVANNAKYFIFEFLLKEFEKSTTEFLKLQTLNEIKFKISRKCSDELNIWVSLTTDVAFRVSLLNISERELFIKISNFLIFRDQRKYSKATRRKKNANEVHWLLPRKVS